MELSWALVDRMALELLAQTAGAVIMGFGVRPQPAARQEAERSGVDIQIYDII